MIDRFVEPVGFLPETVTDEYVLSYCTHGELEKYVTAGMLDETNRQKYDNLMKADEEMNPVILIKYYFK